MEQVSGCGGVPGVVGVDAVVMAVPDSKFDVISEGVSDERPIFVA
jgi:hypothetical protein